MSCPCRTDLHPFISRSTQVSTPYPTLVNSEQRIANLYPWWVGHWPEDRGQYTLPRIVYPEPQWPRGVYPERNDICHVESLIEPNWALPTMR